MKQRFCVRCNEIIKKPANVCSTCFEKERDYYRNRDNGIDVEWPWPDISKAAALMGKRGGSVSSKAKKQAARNREAKKYRNPPKQRG